MSVTTMTDDASTPETRRLEQRLLSALCRHLRQADSHLQPTTRVHDAADHVHPAICAVDVRLTSRVSLGFFVDQGEWWYLVFTVGPLGHATGPRNRMRPRTPTTATSNTVGTNTIRTISHELKLLLHGGINDIPDPLRALSDRQQASQILNRLGRRPSTSHSA